MFLSTLLTSEYLFDGLQKDPKALPTPEVCAYFAEELSHIYAQIPEGKKLNEAETERLIVSKVLNALGWKEQFLTQQKMRSNERRDVPDYLLFNDTEKYQQVMSKELKELRPEEKFCLGVGLLEAKKWEEPLDRAGSNNRNPVFQILRYLQTAQITSQGAVRWGILTNGRIWRLYYAGARSILTQYVEFDLAALIAAHGTQTKLLTEVAPMETRDTAEILQVFLMLLRPEAFSSQSGAGLLERAVVESRSWEEKVAADLRQEVFLNLFPQLINAIYLADEANHSANHNSENKANNDGSFKPDETYLENLRVEALIFLYRTLFILYAEDRKLLPVESDNYIPESLRKFRDDIQKRLSQNTSLGTRSDRYWGQLINLFNVINEGDSGLGIPAYNGGLFDVGSTPILNRIKLPDNHLAPLIDMLSRRDTEHEKKFINYRDLSVQQLGTVYEGLLEFQLTFLPENKKGTQLALKLSPFSRKSTGSYYTPESLVELVLDRSLRGLVDEKRLAFQQTLERLKEDNSRPIRDQIKAGRVEKKGKLTLLAEADPAAAILKLRILDPAMGSGHFLVSLVDWVSDKVAALIDESAEYVQEHAPTWVKDQPYRSPVSDQLDTIRETIRREAKENNWKVLEDHLEDQQIARRVVLKRCVYGVDKNPMAVELAKLALWLHTFTVGAPLSFLDHHIRCGDSLFGEWVGDVIAERSKKGYLFLQKPLENALQAETFMGLIEQLADSDIHEVKESEAHFKRVKELTERLSAFLSVLQGFRWLMGKDKDKKAVLESWLNTEYGDPVETAFAALKGDTLQPTNGNGARESNGAAERFAAWRELIEEAALIAREEYFHHWQVAFPGVWQNWHKPERQGGFDVVVSNPPWDVMKIQQVEWFSNRHAQIAMETRASDRSRMIKDLEGNNPKLWRDYRKAVVRAEQQSLQVRLRGQFPLLGKGDMNLYFLFVEKAFALSKPDALVGLVVPSGIVSDKRTEDFMKVISPTGRLHYFYDFDNRKKFFPEVVSLFKFCVIIMGAELRGGKDARLAFFQQKTEGIEENELFLNQEDFQLMNPNTNTMPVFRSQKDTELTRRIYHRLPILHDHTKGLTWPVKYATLFHMTNDSKHFLREDEIKKEGGYPEGMGRWKRGKEQKWVPLLEGKSIHQYNHRYASIYENKANLKNAALNEKATAKDLANPKYFPNPRYWIDIEEGKGKIKQQEYYLAFRDIARSTDVRTIICTIIPQAGAGNKLPLLLYNNKKGTAAAYAYLVANLNSVPFDYIARKKIHSTSVNYYIFEQLPVVPPEMYEEPLGDTTVGAVVRDHVLKLSYTAQDLAPFARDLGYVDAAGEVLPPIIWNDEERLHLRARLDALYFILYGITDEADIAYILGTFPIFEVHERQAYDGRFRSLDLIQHYVRALQAGDWDTDIPE